MRCAFLKISAGCFVMLLSTAKAKLLMLLHELCEIQQIETAASRILSKIIALQNTGICLRVKDK